MRHKIARFEDLLVWQKSRDLAFEIYRVTRQGEFSRDFGLRAQIQRAAVSVMSNIAEGFERYSRTEFKHFLSIARGSAAEVRSQLHLANKLDYISFEEFSGLHESCLEISRLLASLHSKLDT
jgi:four helix bundle protein